MRMLRLTCTVGVVLLVVLSLVAIGERFYRDEYGLSEDKKPDDGRIVVRRVTPASNAAGEVECTSLGLVEVSYEVSNRSGAQITGLKLGTKCACEVVGPPPETILPGEDETIRVRLRGPFLGRVERKIPLLIDGEADPVAFLDVALRVKFEPPNLVAPKGTQSITFVAGGGAAQELVLEAIELRAEQRWIDGLDLDPPGAIEVRSVQVDELQEPDPTLLRRRYRFLLANKSLPAGQHMTYAIVRTRDGLPQMADSLTLRVDVVDSIAIVPNPLVFRYTDASEPASRRIRIINRAGRQARITPVRYDQELLDIREVQDAGLIVAFDVVAIGRPPSGGHTEVEFDVKEGGSPTLVVRFEPAP
jgi:hypothetical protein